MVNVNGGIVQAFPIHKGTVKGIFTDKLIGNQAVLHCDANSDITYTFTDDTTYSESLLMGEDRALSDDIKSITTTAECTIS